VQTKRKIVIKIVVCIQFFSWQTESSQRLKKYLSYSKKGSKFFALKTEKATLTGISGGYKNNRWGQLTKSLGMIIFWCNLYFHHITRLLAEFVVKWTPLVAWVGAQPLFLAYFDIKSTRMPSTRPYHVSFYPQDTIKILILCAYWYCMLKPKFGGGRFFQGAKK